MRVLEAYILQACNIGGTGGGGNSLRPYSQQRPIRTNLSCCLGLIDNGQHRSTNRLLVLVPHERPHGVMRIPEKSLHAAAEGPENENEGN